MTFNKGEVSGGGGRNAEVRMMLDGWGGGVGGGEGKGEGEDIG